MRRNAISVHYVPGYKEINERVRLFILHHPGKKEERKKESKKERKKERKKDRKKERGGRKKEKRMEKVIK